MGSTITHVEAKLQNVLISLPPNAQTTVLTCAPITAPVGTILEFSGVVQYTNFTNTNDYARPAIILSQDGVPIVDLSATLGAVPSFGKFNLLAILPIVWYLPGDGLSHVYSVAVQTDATSDGNQDAVNSAIFINVI